jgi:hypothetical protein
MSIKVKQVLEDWKDTLLKIPNVTAVGRASGSGKIVIYVKKMSLQILGAIPPQIDGVPVEIRESGEIKLLSMMPLTLELSRTARYRPILGGISIGSIHITAGTLGGMAIDNRTGNIVGLSNNHVFVGGKWGDQEGYLGGEIVQPGVVDGGTLDDLAGYASRAVPVEIGADNLIDACIMEPSVEVSREILDLSLPLYPTLVEPYAGLGVVKSGRTTGVLHGKVTVVDATVDVSGWGVARFVDQVMVEPSIMNGGDSGSLVLSEDGKVAGLGFAGSDKVSVFNKASNVQNLLDIRILGAPFYGVAPAMPSGVGAIALGVGVFLLGLV